MKDLWSHAPTRIKFDPIINQTLGEIFGEVAGQIPIVIK